MKRSNFLFMNIKIVFGVVIALILVFGAIIVLNQPKKTSLPEEDYITNESGDDYLKYEDMSIRELFEETAKSKDYNFSYEIPSSVKDCDSLDKGKDFCYSLVASVTQDEDGCKAISDKTLRDDCYAKLAKTKKDAGFCDNISIGYSECVIDVAIELNDYKLCEKGKSDRQKCNEAVIANNLDLCPEGYARAYCNTAIIEKKPQECEKVLDYSNYCYYTIAINTNNASLCNKTSFNKDLCFFKVAKQTGNANVCENINDKETRDNCVAWVAWVTKNRDLCFKAGDQAQECYQELS